MDFRQDQGKGRRPDREKDRRTLLAAIGVGALWGSGAGLLIATKGTGHVPWQASFAVPIAIGVVLGAIVGGIPIALQRQRTR